MILRDRTQFTKSRNDGLEISVEEYLRYFDVENIPEDHYFQKIYYRSEDINNIQEIEKSIDISLKLFDRLIENVIDYSVEKGFSIEIEIVAKYLRKGLQTEIHEVPIQYEGRSYQEGKKIKTLDGFKYLIKTLRYRVF